MRVLRVLIVLLCASTLAFAAAGCGSGGGKTYSGTKPSRWAASVCGAIGDWNRALAADGTRLGFDLRTTRDLSVVKTKFVTFLEDAKRTSQVMVAKIKAAGAPAVKDGAAIERQLVRELEKAQRSFTGAIAKAKNLSIFDPRAFLAGSQALIVDVQKKLAATGDQFHSLGGQYKDETLNKATAGEPACNTIGG